jgi:hypothetical protein
MCCIGLWVFMGIVTTNLVTKSDSVNDVILNRLSAGFILELYEVATRLLYEKVRIVNNLPTTGYIDGRTNRRASVFWLLVWE